jgi:hypothetical protein
MVNIIGVMSIKYIRMGIIHFILMMVIKRNPYQRKKLEKELLLFLLMSLIYLILRVKVTMNNKMT